MSSHIKGPITPRNIVIIATALFHGTLEALVFRSGLEWIGGIGGIGVPSITGRYQISHRNVLRKSLVQI
jgi:hypothetical protein